MQIYPRDYSRKGLEMIEKLQAYVRQVYVNLSEGCMLLGSCKALQGNYM